MSCLEMSILWSASLNSCLVNNFIFAYFEKIYEERRYCLVGH